MVAWIIGLTVGGFALYLARSLIHRLVTFIWQDASVLLCCGVVALAVTATALNSIGIHPMSVPGMTCMGLVGCIIGALFLRWGETRR